MKAKTYSDSGIILAKRNFGEADRILVVFSRNYGKLSLLAKGVRKPRSRKRGHIEIFNYIRFQAVATNSIDLITEAETIERFAEVKTDLKKVSLAYYFVEAIGRVMHDLEKNEEIFALLLNNLEKLKETSSLRSLRKIFLERLLILLGFLPAGAKVSDIDGFFEDVIERKMNSIRVGRKVLQ